jgi:peptide deformylase
MKILAALPIYGLGCDVLRTETQEIASDYPDLKDIIDAMVKTMDEAMGVGLAAPQIGKSIAIFVTRFTRSSKPIIFINPKITEYYGGLKSSNEGCLSIPQIRFRVPRHNKVDITYYDENFNLVNKTFKSQSAFIVQHEYDHLKGKLYIDYLKIAEERLRLESQLEIIEGGRFTTRYDMIIKDGSLKKRYEF